MVLGQGSERQEDIPSLFIEPLDREALGREMHDVPDDALDWFNHQIKSWPAHLILQEAIYQSSIPIRNFLVTARKSAS